MKQIVILILIGLVFAKVKSYANQENKVDPQVSGEGNGDLFETNQETNLYDRVLHKFYKPYQRNEAIATTSLTVTNPSEEVTQSEDINNSTQSAEDIDKSTQSAEDISNSTEVTQSILVSNDSQAVTEIIEEFNRTEEVTKSLTDITSNEMADSIPNSNRPLIKRSDAEPNFRKPLIFKRQTNARKPLILSPIDSNDKNINEPITNAPNNGRSILFPDDEEDIQFDEKAEDRGRSLADRARKPLLI